MGNFAHQKIVLRQYSPVAEKHLSSFIWRAEHVAWGQCPEFPYLLKICRHYSGDIFAQRAGAFPGKWHHCNGDGVVDTLSDLDIQLSRHHPFCEQRGNNNQVSQCLDQFNKS